MLIFKKYIIEDSNLKRYTTICIVSKTKIWNGIGPVYNIKKNGTAEKKESI